MPDEKYSEVDIEAKAAKILQTTWTLSSDATAFITERVAFQMKNLIRQCRKNYWGVFDEPIDPTTGRKKIWIPLTETAIEAIVKNVDLDTKDINFRARKPSSIGLTSLVRSIVRNHLDANYFGEFLDEAIMIMARDGTVVWKTIEKKDKDGRTTYDIRVVDLLNFAIDPTVRSIDEADFVVERIIMTKDEFERLNLPFNMDKIATVTNISRNDINIVNTNFTSSVNYVEAYEGWGLVPLSLFTGKSADDKELVEGKIVASSNAKGGFTIHDIQKNTKEIKPYEEAWYTRINGRWYGRGIAEKLIMMQLWLNIIVNIRINRSFVSQLGLFKLRRGSGIAPSSISKLAANGAVVVDKMDDIEQFVVQEASQASYSDENNIKDWSERLTNAFQIVTGEELPSSTPATTAVLLNRSAQTGFTLVKEGFGMFLQRWLKRQSMPIIQKSITKQEVIRITGEPEELRTLDEQIVKYLAWQELDTMTAMGQLVNPEEVQNEIESAINKLQSMGNDRYIKILQNIDFTEYDVQVYVTNEEFEKTVMVNDLLTALKIAPEYKDVILPQVFDIMGLNTGNLKPRQPLIPQTQSNSNSQTQPSLPGESMPASGSQAQASPLSGVLGVNSAITQ